MPTLCPKLRSFRRETRGLAAIEAAFIFPVLIVLYVGLVDITNLLSVDRRVTNTASTLADLVTQTDSTVTTATIDGIFESARSIFEPLDVDQISLTLYNFGLEDGSPTLKWKYNNGTACGDDPEASDEMAALMADGNDVVVARVCYDYAAIIGWFTGHEEVTLEDELMLRPRQSATLECTGCPTG
jgi:Flp pilus assembly protein TadG